MADSWKWSMAPYMGRSVPHMAVSVCPSTSAILQVTAYCVSALTVLLLLEE